MSADLLPLLWMAPALLLLGLVFLWPWVHYCWLSFHASSLLTGLATLPNGGANWQRLLQDGRFWQDALQTVRFAGVSVGLELGLGLLIALLLHRPSRGRGLLRALVLIPWALPGTVMALGWRWILNDPHGPLNALIQSLGRSPFPFLTSPSTTWAFTVLADVWKTTPFVAIILLAGLQSIPRDLEEALRLEGAGHWTVLRRLQWPLLTPYVSLALLFRLAQAFGVFDLIQLLTGGGPAGSTESLASYAYLQAMRFLDFGYSATLMLATFLMVLVLSLLWLGGMRLVGARR
ncbi:MAG: sugar ABC transporter permease [Cyanobacteriota bacterium]|nr:sugar ABC transporter permease [Cyanobacteriota bacterium]